jgi:hypothetical protein
MPNSTSSLEHNYSQSKQQIENSGVNIIQVDNTLVCLYSSVIKLQEVLNSNFNKDVEDVEKAGILGITYFKKKLDSERGKVAKEINKLKKLEEIALVAIEENKKYKKWYGTLLSPRRVIVEFWNEGAVAQYGLLVAPSNWKIKLMGENGTNAKRYWIDKLIEMKLVKFWSKGKYTAEVSFPVALEILHKTMQKEGTITYEKDKNES